MKMVAKEIPAKYRDQYHLGSLVNMAVKAISITKLKPVIPIIGFGRMKTLDCHEFIGPSQENSGFHEQDKV